VPRMITAAAKNVIMEIDKRPALEVFKEEIGELLAHDLRRVAGYIFAGFPIQGSDTGDYLVRNLTAIDPTKGWIAVAEAVEPGRRVLFCRRDHDSAIDDLRRMVRDVAQRAGPDARAALYFSCIGRGRHQFGPDSAELRIVRDELGDLPLVGFFGNGEISNDRLYGYTGVLAVFR
jgi:small ligand-binding sensory domain FIST